MDPTLTRVFKVIHFIYNTTLEKDRGIQDLVVGYMAQHSSAYFALQEFETFIAGNTEFIIDAKESSQSSAEQRKPLTSSASDDFRIAEGGLK